MIGGPPWARIKGDGGMRDGGVVGIVRGGRPHRVGRRQERAGRLLTEHIASSHAVTGDDLQKIRGIGLSVGELKSAESVTARGEARHMRTQVRDQGTGVHPQGGAGLGHRQARVEGRHRRG